MHSSSLTIKGQITIPADIRKQFGLHPGDRMGFMVQDDQIILFRKETDIESSFGISHPKKSVSLQKMEEVIRKRGGDDSR